MIHYYLFNNASVASQYGIGTYVCQLSRLFHSWNEVELNLIELFADVKEYTIRTDDDGAKHFYIPASATYFEDEVYCRNVFYYLCCHIPISEQNVFHFNYIQHYPLAVLLKRQYLQSRFLLTIHYFNWSFQLKGDYSRFQSIIESRSSERSEEDEAIINSFYADRMFLRLVDKVIALSAFSKTVLIHDYKITEQKILLVHNGLADERKEVKHSMRTIDGEHILLFVGRLDELKGLTYLINAFRICLERRKDLRLVIVGEGDFNKYLSLCKEIWKHVTFTGKLNRDNVLELYQKADIGILPSMTEQCSYTAIEMMMFGLPLIGSDSTGMNEMMAKEHMVHVIGKSQEEVSRELAQKILRLLENDCLWNNYSKCCRELYIQKYSLPIMERTMKGLVFRRLDHEKAGLSTSFFPEIDSFFFLIIVQQPTIDVNFEGIVGIGVWLWWRICHLTDEAYSLRLQEYLIYYLDWLSIELDNSIIEGKQTELGALLYSLVNNTFYFS